ncbi:MAG: ribonuclease P protein component [Bacteroidia bacterium]|jgi:ribonuclease P protein component
MAFTFTKEERLSRKTLIAQLFEKGNPVVKGFPFRFSWVYVTLENPYPVQILFPVSKRSIPQANQRNRIRRLMRELYRMRKHELYAVLQQNNRQIALSMSYLAQQPLRMSELKPLFDQAFHKLLHEVTKSH